MIEFKDVAFQYEQGSSKGKIENINLTIHDGEVVLICGESGCGKSVTSLSIMRLVDPVTGKNEGGEILFDGTDILKLPEPEMRKLRGNRISMIFQ